MTSLMRSVLAGLLLVLSAVLLVSQPAAAEPVCDVPDPPPICSVDDEPGTEPTPVPDTTPEPEALDLQLRSSGLAFGRDFVLTPASQPVTVEVIDGEALRISVSARHSSRSVRASIAVGYRSDCVDPETGIGTTSQGLAARRDVTAGPGQVATVSDEITISKQRNCTVRHEVSASGQAQGLAEVRLPRATVVYRYASTPFGWLDVATGGPGNVRVAGWTIDPETAAPIGVHVYVDGTFAGAATAGGSRPDVGAVHRPYGPAHGFDLTVSARPGTRHVCVYAINVGDGTVNPQLGCSTVTVALPAACRPIQSQIDALRSEISQLQAELRFAAPSEKPPLIAQIRNLQSQVTALQAQLDRCIAAA
jgi:hypothetical protein